MEEVIQRLLRPGQAEGIFAGWEETMIWSCLEGVMGDIYADDQNNPTCAVALLADFAFYGGKASGELVRFWPEGNERKKILMVPQNEEWASLIEMVYGKRAKKVIRYSVKKEPEVFDRERLRLAAESLHAESRSNILDETTPNESGENRHNAGYELKGIDQEIYAYARNQSWCRDWVSQFDTWEQYHRLGLGVAALKDGIPVAGASSYTRYKNGIEIQIDTHPDYRRQGLGYACGAKLILDCLSRGLYPSWDAHNLWSLGLAEKLGYHRGEEYAAYEVEPASEKMKRNYQKELDEIIAKHQKAGEVPTLLLHSCCAPCSSYVLEYLSEYFAITVFYYNPNIYPDEEYYKRVEEQKQFIERFPARHPIQFMEGSFDKERFYETAKGMEEEPEGGKRCFHCYELRLREAAKLASERGMDYFTTTLSISPLKNAGKLNEIGQKLEEEYGVKYLTSDFKKKDGYKRSVELSREYDMYRQDYCGCVFSMRQRQREQAVKTR